MACGSDEAQPAFRLGRLASFVLPPVTLFSNHPDANGEHDKANKD
jgi:hypothetical protein